MKTRRTFLAAVSGAMAFAARAARAAFGSGDAALAVPADRVSNALGLKAFSGSPWAQIHPGLARLIGDYEDAVQTAIDLMVRSGMRRPASTFDWLLISTPQHGRFVDGTPYFAHGIGCWVGLSGGAVDFDFGEQGEIDMFDCYRLFDFAGKRLASYGFADERTLKAAYGAALQSGAIRLEPTAYNEAMLNRDLESDWDWIRP